MPATSLFARSLTLSIQKTFPARLPPDPGFRRSAIYHLMNRGDRREDIFVDDEDRRLFLKTFSEACQKTGWQIHRFWYARWWGPRSTPIQPGRRETTAAIAEAIQANSCLMER